MKTSMPNNKTQNAIALQQSCKAVTLIVAIILSSVLPYRVRAAGTSGTHHPSTTLVNDVPNVKSLRNDSTANSALSQPSEPQTRARLSEAYGRLPLSFEVNRGQTRPLSLLYSTYLGADNTYGGGQTKAVDFHSVLLTGLHQHTLRKDFRPCSNMPLTSATSFLGMFES